MKIKIRDLIIDSNNEPILLILDEQDKKNISNMHADATKYCSFPNPYDLSIIKDFMKLDNEIVKEHQTAIISLNTDDFQYWKLINNLKGDVLEYKRKFKINNTIYHCISSVTDLCSLRFDNFIETDNARLNKEYLQIISLLNVQKNHV